MPSDAHDIPNVAKYNVRTSCVALLHYPDFFEDPFPALAASWVFPEGAQQPASVRHYRDSLNPPILHRKELLVGEGHPKYAAWAELTSSAEAVGLFDNTTTIGFAMNWRQLLQQKGLTIVGHCLVPAGNDIPPDDALPDLPESGTIRRHLTALSRAVISTPVQLLQRYGFLDAERSFFDYGCGRGGDINALACIGVSARGWDPYFCPDEPLKAADTVNLGFVINVIENPAERVEALSKAFALAKTVLCVSVMLNNGNAAGKPYRDGFLTSRNTFQKYFSQAELRDYLELALDREAFMVAPGIAFVFATAEEEQRFASTRFRRHGLARTLIQVQRTRFKVALPARTADHRPSGSKLHLAQERANLAPLWATTLELGRHPEPDEVPVLNSIIDEFGSLNRALRKLQRHFDQTLLASAALIRADDLCLTLAMQQFNRRPPYRSLDERFQRDIKAFFGNYRVAQNTGLRLLQEAANPASILDACRRASSAGLGYLDGTHSLQLHISLVERLPVVLRVYVNCGLRLWDSLSEIQLIKIHIESGKLSLMEFEDFDSAPLPRLLRRIKVNLRKLDYDIFDYGTEQYPMPFLYHKSRYLNEEHPGYAEQAAFDEALERIGIPGASEFGPSAESLARKLEAHRLCINGSRIEPSTSIPHLDTLCGERLTYRALIECGETQRQLGLRNLPLNAETYNALHDLAVNVLDPVIDYYGPIRLTYGFASSTLTKQIRGGIAPKLDQHASCEHLPNGKPICDRRGAACDFIVEDEAMDEVAHWIINHVVFDRLYYYGRNRPIHVSFSPTPARLAYALVPTSSGSVLPRPFSMGLNTALNTRRKT
ncbi:DNA phosphorothioation-associated putative methyltransferase [Paraburkholderia unamae]|uniref:DNA phosphorothioation-associated putative methyltransferase n=1 Tax=Paraburkholderia unamae TaxID=219649 RepID=UPI001C658A48|nr:DNA phosphorothioation-associated putative methyltransferase [Paraburkholderia unamae]